MHLLCFLGDSFQIREMIQENGKHHPKLCSFCPFFWGQVRWSYHEFKKIRSTHWMGLVYFTYKPPELPSLGVVDMWTQQKKNIKSPARIQQDWRVVEKVSVLHDSSGKLQENEALQEEDHPGLGGFSGDRITPIDFSHGFWPFGRGRKTPPIGDKN